MFFNILNIRPRPKDLVTNGMLHPFNDTPNTLSTQADSRQGGNFLRAHSLPEVEPKDHTVTLLVGSGQATLEVLINLFQEHSESNIVFASVSPHPGLGVDIAGGNMSFIPPAGLAMA